MRGIDDVESMKACAAMLLRHPRMRGPRNAFLLAAAALRLAGDNKLADQVEATALECPVTPPSDTSEAANDWEYA